jgi:hypothetical protein
VIQDTIYDQDGDYALVELFDDEERERTVVSVLGQSGEDAAVLNFRPAQARRFALALLLAADEAQAENRSRK